MPIPKNAPKFRLKTINEWVKVIGAHRCDSGDVFTVIDQSGRQRTFLANPELYDAPSSKILALWATLSAKEAARLKREGKEKVAGQRRREWAEEHAAEQIEELTVRMHWDYEPSESLEAGGDDGAARNDLLSEEDHPQSDDDSENQNEELCEAAEEMG